jgi:VIT1/CCC1 family predicted Fe2+/Mn2+ transporter
MVAFVVGALLPLLTNTVFSAGARLWVTVASVAVALALTGYVSARLGQADVRRAMLRNVAGGLLAMVVTYLIGQAVGTKVG